MVLTNGDRVTHICVSKLTIIGLGNDLSPGRHQAIIRTNAGILLIQILRTYCSEILCEFHIFSLKTALKNASAKSRQFCLNLTVLTTESLLSICSINTKLTTVNSISRIRRILTQSNWHWIWLVIIFIIIRCTFSLGSKKVPRNCTYLENNTMAH